MTENVLEEDQGAQIEYIGNDDAYVPKTLTKDKAARWNIFVISKHILSAHCGLLQPTENMTIHNERDTADGLKE